MTRTDRLERYMLFGRIGRLAREIFTLNIRIGNAQRDKDERNAAKYSYVLRQTSDEYARALRERYARGW